MDSKVKIRNLVQGMDDAALGELASEVASEMSSRRKGIEVEDITVERLRDPQFRAEVRAELESILKSRG